MLADKIILISDGTQGVGAGIARATTQEGAVVIITGRRREVGAAFAASLTSAGAEATLLPVEVARPRCARKSGRGGGAARPDPAAV